MTLLPSIFLVDCTDIEDAAITDVEAQEETAVETEVEKTQAKSNNDLFAVHKLIEVDEGGLSSDQLTLNTNIFLYSSYKNTSYLFQIKGTHISLLKSNPKKPSCNYSGLRSSKLTPKYY